MYCKLFSGSVCCRSAPALHHAPQGCTVTTARTRVIAQMQPPTPDTSIHPASPEASWPQEDRGRFLRPTETQKLPNQAESLSKGQEGIQEVQLVADRSVADLDCFTELLAIGKNGGAKTIGFIGTRNMGFMHQKLIETLSFALIHTGHQIVTSGSTGTNAAVIKGALQSPEGIKLLKVIIPQSLSKQPEESQELLQQVPNLETLTGTDHLSLLEASRLCNRRIIEETQQIICFAFHDSRLLLETCTEAKEKKKIVTLFYLD